MRGYQLNLLKTNVDIDENPILITILRIANY